MKRWPRFILSIFVITALIFILPRMLRLSGHYRYLTEHAREKGINNAAIFYTQEPLSLEAEKVLRSIKRGRQGYDNIKTPEKNLPYFPVH